nr:PREDICTED: jacalin-related lectin 3-like [Daucus carota subsp. sativus]
MSTMIKVGPPFHPAGSTWDNKGKTDIAQIFVSCSRYRINFMYFVYAEDGGNRLVLSKFGEDKTSHSMETVTFDYPSEYITRVRGQYTDAVSPYDRYLWSITFYTNKGTYGPYVPTESINDGKFVDFNYQVGGKLCGFFGSYLGNGIETIGFYVEPQEKLAKQPGKLVSVDEIEEPPTIY